MGKKKKKNKKALYVDAASLPFLDSAPYRVADDPNFKLSSIDCNDKANLSKKTGNLLLEQNKEIMFRQQEKLYAENEQALLIIFQAMDAAGKDGAIKHVMSGVNPQGTHVTSFKVPNAEERDHDYMWRINKALPRRGEIGIFNRSHYEEVVVTQLHDLLRDQQIPDELIGDGVWEARYEQIKNWEDYLTKQGYVILKFFLHLSKEEQRERLLDRIEEEDKNWKFSAGDIAEREHWDDYQELYQKMIRKTATEYAPWYVVPADRKWFSRALISQVVAETLLKMDPKIPELSAAEKGELEKWRILLEDKDN